MRHVTGVVPKGSRPLGRGAAARGSPVGAIGGAGGGAPSAVAECGTGRADGLSAPAEGAYRESAAGSGRAERREGVFAAPRQPRETAPVPRGEESRS
ncbi:hypothetical protein FHS38_001152 [Streptomyces netropsis]|uniref:Uncharacterized protein n=1 Tax=Streptomyces netropsis TaxID=55404 RepID=A0A7W7PCK2_STRNE|nr:hypothetical protein [Streptomyces netropsis]GGR26953.1 hypothetical protein GCM10010219_34720 [Streptomyces netropsis]